jgi:protein TonB
LQSSLRAQGGDWQTFSPEGEEFSILMPANPKAEEGQELYHRMTLNTRLYLSQQPGGPVFAVASFSGIKANSAMYTELQRLNSYVDAFKNWFPSKVRGKEAIAKLTQVGDKVLNGNNGREYKLVIGDLSGTAQMFATRRRFYAVVTLNTKKDDAISERFLSSLTLPEKVAQPEAPAEKVAAAESVPAVRKKGESNDDSAAKPDASVNSGGTGASGGDTGVSGAASAKAGGQTGDKPDGANANNPDTHMISGGLLNAKALYLPPPDYPEIARQAKASGTVTVQIIIDEMGNVIAAHAVSGHPLLQAASVTAARLARFSPTTLSGAPVKVQGIVTYNFVAQ